MKLAARLTLGLVLGASLAASLPASAAPHGPSMTNFQAALVSLAGAETDTAKQTALNNAAALFNNKSKNYATDLQDLINAVKKIEAAYGTSDPTMNQFLDNIVIGAYLNCLLHGNDAFRQAALKETGKRNFRAVVALTKTHEQKVKTFSKAFPDTPPSKPISRVKKLTACRVFELYGAALAKRYKIALNAV